MQPAIAHRDGAPASDGLERVDSGRAIPVATDDVYQLNLEELSMASSWDVISPDENKQSAALAMIEPVFELQALPVPPTRQPPGGLS